MPYTLENDTLRINFNEATGELASISMKATGEELLRSDSQTLIFADDSDTWAHSKLHFTGPPAPIELVNIRTISCGAVQQTIRVTQRHGMNLIIRDYTLYRSLPQLHMRVRVDWRETKKCLKFAYPMSHYYMHVRAQAPYGYADREIDGEEYPMQQWVDVSGCTAGAETRPNGLAILNDGKYAYDVHDRTLLLTVLRSPFYANHEPFVVEDGSDEYPVIDYGMQEFNIVLLPHEGGKEMDLLDRRAALLNAPPVILPEYAHKGSLSASGSFVRVSGTVLLDAMKLAEDGSGDLIFHLHETMRQECDAVLSLPTMGITVKKHFIPGQLRALRISPASGTVTEVDLLEHSLTE